MVGGGWRRGKRGMFLPVCGGEGLMEREWEWEQEMEFLMRVENVEEEGSIGVGFERGIRG